MKAPCKGCEMRHINCHSHCKAYQAYHIENAKRLEANRLANEAAAFQYDSRTKTIKKKSRRR